MNWKDDQIEKLILFYSHNSLFLVPVSGQYVIHGHNEPGFRQYVIYGDIPSDYWERAR